MNIKRIKRRLRAQYKDKKFTGIRVSIRDWDELNKIAKEIGSDRAKVIRACIEEFIDSYYKQKE